MNLYLKAGCPDSPDRIDAYIRIMNGLRSAEDNFRAALGEERSDPSEYTPVKQHHIKAVVDTLKHTLGANTEDLFGVNRHKNSPFGGGSRPWVRTQNPGNLAPGASAAEIREEVVSWVSAQFEANPFPS